jgi:hypothetical protein
MGGSGAHLVRAVRTTLPRRHGLPPLLTPPAPASCSSPQAFVAFYLQLAALAWLTMTVIPGLKKLFKCKG